MYRGEIQNDSNGGNYNRSLAYSPSVSGLGDGGRGETRNFAVGAPLRGSGIGRCEEEEYNCCGLYGRGENEEMEDDPCWDGYEMIGTKMKKGREVPNCVPVGEGKPFTKKQLTKIILDKNKVIADLEENAYGGADELEGGVMTQAKLNSGSDTLRHLWENRKELAAQVARFSLSQLTDVEEVIEYYLPKPSIGAVTKEFYRELQPVIKREIQAKVVDMARGMMGEGFWDDVRKGLVKHNERKKTTPISEEDWKKQMEDFKAPTEAWGADELNGGAAAAKPTPPSGVAAAAEALQPVRTAIQNGIGDLIYGKETDPRKQKKGLLGISEEGKEESKKKVIKNIVVPAVTLFNDTWDGAFDPEKLKKRRTDESLAEGRKTAIKVAERDGYMYKTPDGKYTYDAGEMNARNEVVRKPRNAKIWVVTNPAKNVGYYRYDMEGKAQGVSPYIKIPNLIKEAGKYYTIDDLKKNNIPFFIPVDRLSTQPQAENEEKWRGGFEGDELWVPEDKAREIFQSLNQYKVKMDEEKERKYYESLTEVEKREYREKKALEKDTGMTEAAKAKVAKDIADEEAKENPDTERLAKMKAAQEKVRVKGVDNFYKGQTQGKQVSERIYGDNMRKDAAERQASDAQEQADAAATFKAMSPAERSAQIDAYRKDLQEQGFSEADIEDMVSQIGASAEGVIAVGGAGSDDDDDDESVEEIRIMEVKVGKKLYWVDAPPMREDGTKAGLPLGSFKAAIGCMMGIGNRRVYDPETEEEMGMLKDPEWKKVAMKVYNDEKEWRAANLKKLGFERDEDTDGDSVTSESSKGGGGEPDDDELVGEGAIEFTLQKAGKSLFNPTGDMTKAGVQTFTPDYDAYGATIEQGRKNAFNLTRSMYNQQQAIEIPGFDLIEDNTSLRFYIKDDEDVIMVGIRGTDVKSWTDLYTWAVIGAKQDFRMTTRFQDDLQKLLLFQKEYSLQEFYYVGVGSSLAGSIADRFLDMGLLNEAITYNPSIEKKYILDESIDNHRVYLDTDPLFILMGQYAPNTEIRVNAGKTNFYNPIKEKDYLIKSHSIYPVYNPAFEGGGMMGAGKTYTIEEWKAIFDAKLEKKRQQIEAREAKKKQTAKAKRERAKARRDGRDEPPPLETPATFRTSRVMKATPPKEREPEKKDGRISLDGKTLFYKDVKQSHDGATRYELGRKFYYVEDPRDAEDMNLDFYKSRQVYSYTLKGVNGKFDLIGRLGEEKEPFQGLMKQVIKAEFPSVKDYRETMGLEAPKKPRLKVVAPASARVELREELVAEQPREPEGQFAPEPEQLQLVVSEIAKQPQGAFMKLMKSPKLTEADRRLFMRLNETKMTPKMRAILLGRSGLARRVMEIMGLDESAFQTKKARLKIADTTEMRVKSETARVIDAQGWIDIKKEWKKVARFEINSVLKRTGNKEPAVKSAKDKLTDIGKWCVASVECLRDAMITDWQGAWTINQEGRMVDADGNKFFSRGKVGTDVGKNKTPLLTIKDTTKTASDTGQDYDEVRTYNLVIGEKGQAILLDGGGDGYEKWTIPMRTLYGFFPLMGLPIPTCKKQGRYGMMKLEIDWKEMPLVRSYKSLTAKAKEEIQEKLRSEYAPKLTAFIDIARSKLEEIVEEALKGRVKYADGTVWQPQSKWHTETWVSEE